MDVVIDAKESFGIVEVLFHEKLLAPEEPFSSAKPNRLNELN